MVVWTTTNHPCFSWPCHFCRSSYDSTDSTQQSKECDREHSHPGKHCASTHPRHWVSFQPQLLSIKQVTIGKGQQFQCDQQEIWGLKGNTLQCSRLWLRQQKEEAKNWLHQWSTYMLEPWRWKRSSWNTWRNAIKASDRINWTWCERLPIWHKWWVWVSCNELQPTVLTMSTFQC